MSPITNKDLYEIKRIIAKIADKAAKVIMQNINSPIEIKADNTPVTKADKESDKLINKELLKAFPNIPILSEERKPQSNAFGNNLHWIIDPLDGTKSFIEGDQDFCVCIALALNTRPILGCIAHPPSEITWAGGSEIGAYKKNNKGDFVKINCRDIPEEGPSIAISKHHIGPKLEKWLSSINFINKLKVGSAIKFTLIAEGKADIFPRTSPTYEWDSAAGEAIIQGSRGHVTQMNGENMVYGREDKKNPNFIAFGRPNWKKFIKGNNSG
jgi:3'(2'), 5'-bisphosphate nucleotidase